MTHLTAEDLRRRARLQAMIDRKDAERGRPLTETKKAVNLTRALTHCWICNGYVGWTAEKCQHCGHELV